MTRDILTFYL